MSLKERTEMPVQESAKRIGNFQEVALGYTAEMAAVEAFRCLNCKKPMCVNGCPVGVNIPGFISAIKQGDIARAAKILKEKNSLPAVCGRVCPQETQCEAQCILGKKGSPVAIGRLERYAADWVREKCVPDPEKTKSRKKKVAIIGSGPAGLTVAGDLAKMGYQVTIFEALHIPGGVLMYGIPEFRLPKAVVQQEINYIKKLGVKIEVDIVVGKTVNIEELLEEGFAAAFIGTGAGLPSFMNIPGENLNGIYSANEFLTRCNLMKAYLFPEYLTPIKVGQRVAVIGGGNVAMDAARTALRLGAKESYIIYRRSMEEMPARHEEVEHAKEEGIIFNLLTTPVAYEGDEAGNVKSMALQKFKLGAPDTSGRRSPIPIKGSEYKMDIDNVVVAIGTSANPLVPQTTPGLILTKKGYIQANEKTSVTSRPNIFAGGDIVSGSATVILAMGAGKRAARAIHEYLQNA